MGNIKKYLPLILIFIITFSVRIFWYCQKDYLFVDDPISFVSATPSTTQNNILFKNSWDNYNFIYNYEYNANELKTLFFAHENNIKSLYHDLKRLYLSDFDEGHSNLYYSILRIWSFNLKNISLSSLIFYGFTLNLLIFSISFFLMYKLLQLIVTDEKYIYTGLLLAFISTASISNTLLFREYQLQELGFILISYIFTKTYLWIIKEHNVEILNNKNIFLYSLALSFFFLTGYYSIIYSLLLLIIILWLMTKKINFTYQVFYKIGSVVLLSIIFTLIADIHYFSFLPDYTNSILTPFTSLLLFEKNLYTCFDILQKTMFYHVILFYGLILILFLKSKDIKNDLMLILSVTSLLWSIICLLFAPYFDIRYYLPAVPVLSLILLYYIMKFDFKYALILCILYLFGIIYPNVKFNNFDTIRPFLFYVHDHNNFVFKNPAKIPMIFKDYQHTISSFVIYSDDNQKILFVSDIPTKNFKYKEYILFFNKNNIEQYQEQIRHNNIVSRGCTKFDDCYVIVDNR